MIDNDYAKYSPDHSRHYYIAGKLHDVCRECKILMGTFKIAGGLEGIETLAVGENVCVMVLGSARVIAVGNAYNGSEGMAAFQELIGMDGRLGSRIEVLPISFVQERGL